MNKRASNSAYVHSCVHRDMRGGCAWHGIKRRLIPKQASACRRSGGFTLIEILVAMTIIAVGVSALVSSAGASAWRADYLREREFGRWVASNTLTELQSLPSWPSVGTTNKQVTMGQLQWFVRTRTQAVADDDLRRVDIQVRRDEDAENYIYLVTGFVGNPETRQGDDSDANFAQ